MLTVSIIYPHRVFVKPQAAAKIGICRAVGADAHIGPLCRPGQGPMWASAPTDEIAKSEYAFQFRRAHTLSRKSLGGADMTETIDKRVRELANYVLESGATVRAAAERFGVSKSTVHKDLTQRLERCDRPLWRRVRRVLDQNKAERHLRGGEATRKKYQIQNAACKTIDKSPKKRHNE